MIKNIFIALLLVFVQTMSAQEPVSYTEVITVEGKSSIELSEIMRRWVAVAYKNPDKVMRYDNGNNEIIVDGVVDYDPGTFSTNFLRGFIRYNLYIRFKDGRMRVEMSNPYHVTTNLKGGINLRTVYKEPLTKEQWKSTKLGSIQLTQKIYENAMGKARDILDNRWNFLINSINNNIKTIESRKVEEDW
ncbi:MAG: DUF4468 domain-containing protein [Prevotella sp.]|nr:DUF4468 domain-containing protein [Candidatus Prevotella equi]